MATSVLDPEGTVALPALAAALPWAGASPVAQVRRQRQLVFGTAEAACTGAATVCPAGAWRVWKQRYRLIRLIDHCDMFLGRTRSRRWFCRHVDVEGAWPDHGPFIAMTFHWGAGLWALGDLRASGVLARFLSAGIDPARFH
jgi:hypothetical protein